MSYEAWRAGQKIESAGAMDGNLVLYGVPSKVWMDQDRCSQSQTGKAAPCGGNLHVSVSCNARVGFAGKPSGISIGRIDAGAGRWGCKVG